MSHTDAVRALLAAGANVEAAHDGIRPLHMASSNGHVIAATLLFDAGAAVNALSNTGHTSIALATTPALLAARGGA